MTILNEKIHLIMKPVSYLVSKPKKQKGPRGMRDRLPDPEPDTSPKYHSLCSLPAYLLIKT